MNVYPEDFLGSLRCDCGDQASAALEQIGNQESGVFLYMKQEGKRVGLLNESLKHVNSKMAQTLLEKPNEMLGLPLRT